MRLRFALWGVVVAVFIGVLALEIHDNPKIETDILALLPASEVDPVEQQATRAFTEQAANRTVFLVGAPDERDTQKAATLFVERLTKSGLFERISHRLEGSEEALFKLLFPYREQLLTPELRQILRQPDGGQLLLEHATRRLYNPLSPRATQYLDQDPLMLYSQRLSELAVLPGKMEVRDGVLMVEIGGRQQVFISATLAGSPFSRDVQDRLAQTVATSAAQLRQQFTDLRISYLGTVRFAHVGATSSQRDIKIIGAGSLIGIILLTVIVFGTLRHLLLAVIPITVGMVFAAGVCFTVFDSVHIVTLVFGSSLIGVCIDYSFHYFAEQRLAQSGWRPLDGLRHIFPGITLGAITSVIGYLSLLVAPFPGLKQMALFSSVGLAGAYGTVVCFYPLLIGKALRRRRPAILRLTALLLRAWEENRWRRWRWLAGGGGVVAAMIGLWLVDAKDDPRLLHQMPKSLVQEYGEIQRATGGFDVSRFLVVEGATSELVLQNEIRVLQQLAQLRKNGALRQYFGISTMVASRSQQVADHRLLQAALLSKTDQLTPWMEELGFAEGVIEATRRRFVAAPQRFLTVQQWKENPISEPWRHLWLGETARGVASIVLLGEIKDEGAVKAVAADMDGVRYVNKVSNISELLSRYRVLTSWLLALSFLVVAGVLAWRYGFARAARVVLAPALAALFALGGLGLAGYTVNLFSVLALLLTLAIGVDYTIFFAERRGKAEATMLAICLSATTSILSFGLLSFSQIPFLKTFGFTLLLGIGFALLLSPMARWRTRKKA